MKTHNAAPELEPLEMRPPSTMVGRAQREENFGDLKGSRTVKNAIFMRVTHVQLNVGFAHITRVTLARKPFLYEVYLTEWVLAVHHRHTQLQA